VQYCRCGASRAVTRSQEPEKPVYLPPTLVVHVRLDAFDVYVGRQTESRLHLKPQGWGNPFKIGRDGDRVKAINAYRDWLL
jgi:hypothetical protein